jgi:branched-chain amino acid transport system ATP-binding protein
MLAMARVLVDAPLVLIADELSLGLAPTIVDQTYRSLARLREAGTALLVIEQHVSHALELCDRVVVMEHGGVSWSGLSSEARERVQAFLEVGSSPEE